MGEYVWGGVVWYAYERDKATDGELDQPIGIQVGDDSIEIWLDESYPYLRAALAAKLDYRRT